MCLMINFRNRCQRLLHLNLGYNKISHVEPGDFEWAEDLEILLLRNNILTKLKAETFKGAGALHIILLRKRVTWSDPCMCRGQFIILCKVSFI